MKRCHFVCPFDVADCPYYSLIGVFFIGYGYKPDDIMRNTTEMICKLSVVMSDEPKEIN